jgi:SAM-dependent methyltransferase
MCPERQAVPPQAARISDLKSWLAAQEPVLGSGWVATLEDRKREEAEFHNADREGHRDESRESTPNRRFYAAFSIVEDYIDRWIRRHAVGGAFLDYACGNGHLARRAAESGASVVVGIDISDVSVRNAAERAAQAGFGDVTHFLQRDCEDTRLPADRFDACLCSGMLHHLDLERAFPELHRIMAPGGRILGVEALSYNPAIQLYRRLTPQLRTEFEARHILGLKELRLASRWFSVENVRFWLMAAPLGALLPAGPLRQGAIAAGHVLDKVLTRVPGLRLWSWVFSFELVKHGEGNLSRGTLPGAARPR